VATTAPRRLTTPSSVNAAIKQIADVMRRANHAGAKVDDGPSAIDGQG
jgi:hypothetical protein